MSWQKFRENVLKKIKSPPKSSDELAETIATQYDLAMRKPPSGDTFNRNFVIKADVDALSNHIKKVYDKQSKTPVPLPLVQLISAGFPKYWRNAELSILFPPKPTPAFLPTIVISNRVTFPGLPVTKIYPIGVPQTPEQVVENIISAAKIHLLTISGTIQFNCLYPAVPSPIPGIATLPWFGYTVYDKTDDKEENELKEDLFLLITLGFLISSYQGDLEKSRLIAYLIFKRDKALQKMELDAPSLKAEQSTAENAVNIITEQVKKNQVPDETVFQWYQSGKKIKLINYFKTNSSEQITFG